MEVINADVIVIGAGVVGLATAYALLEKRPGLRVVVVDKESKPACHQSGRNSGVIHSGLYYKPGSLKAQLCHQGRRKLIDFADKFAVDYDICGKLVVATNEQELASLTTIQQRGLANGLSGIEWLDGAQLKEIEPAIAGMAALRVPEAGIIDFPQVAQQLAQRIRELSGLKSASLQFGVPVVSIEVGSEQVRIATANSHYVANRLVNCAGLQSDRIARMAGIVPEVQIVPFRGDYYMLTPSARHLINHLVYPVPDPAFPFLGVHFTRMISGEIECGPNAVFNFDREGYSKLNFSVKDSWDSLTFPGTWRLLAKHWRYAAGEYHRAFSKAAFVDALRKLLPSISADQLVPARAGIRAQAMRRDGSLVDDFVIQTVGKTTHVLNAPSPAATSCLAIGEYIVEQMGEIQ